jgi:two-component system response regulator AtoC
MDWAGVPRYVKPMVTRVLIVDDDSHLRLALSKALTRKGVDVVDLAGGEGAIEPLKTGMGPAGHIDVCVLDLRMPGMSGLDVLRRTLGRRVPVVVLTGHGTVPDAVEAMRLGAVNFVQKPVDADELFPIIMQAVRTDSLGAADATILGASPAILSFLERLDRAARSAEPVLLIGETGTGKELCARRLHQGSAQSRGPFVSMNAAAIPRDQIEGELFGHKKGVPTSASEAKEGLLHRAAEGTLFLDEIGELPLDVQAKLLRAIEDRRFRPMGADVDRPFKGRILAATHRDLKTLVEQGRFRADLSYRLSVIPLHMPPLRERDDDIILIARAWLSRAMVERPAGRSADVALAFSPEAEDHLRSYAWPGNVRELINVVKRAALFAPGDVVDGDLVTELLEDSPFAHAAELPLLPLSTSSGDGPRAGQRVTLEELEKTHIRRLLDELHNVSEVSRIVGIDRRTLQRKMIAWGFRDPKPNDGADEG